jgi:3-hydroxymyristoyl/3-hydroxydecanoyl-(acyl carrier protein) dehydratase
VYQPDVLEEARDATAVRLRFRVSPALAYFSGHFAAWPILPGIVQVHWAVDFARRYFPLRGEFGRLEHIKFHRVVRPNMELALTLRYDAARCRLEFLYDNASAKYSSGVACFGEGQ